MKSDAHYLVAAEPGQATPSHPMFLHAREAISTVSGQLLRATTLRSAYNGCVTLDMLNIMRMMCDNQNLCGMLSAMPVLAVLRWSHLAYTEAVLRHDVVQVQPRTCLLRLVSAQSLEELLRDCGVGLHPASQLPVCAYPGTATGAGRTCSFAAFSAVNWDCSSRALRRRSWLDAERVRALQSRLHRAWLCHTEVAFYGVTPTQCTLS
jgi:hypothetical protein